MRFLYYNVTELWGHREKAEPGNGMTGASGVPEWQANPPFNGKT